MSNVVDTASIERELSHLWQKQALEAGGQVVTRALTLNLVVRARDSATAELVSEIVQRLTASHPNRAVLALLRPDETPSRLEAFVQANCLLASQGQPQVCGEQITLDARGTATAQVASLVLPLLVADLPVALWLPGPAPFDDPLLIRLQGMLDRLIVDSRAFADPARDLVALAAFETADHQGVGAGGSGPAVSDLNWSALTPWRELTAQFFDTRPLLPHLRRLDHVVISYVPPAGPRLNPTAGLLLAGWLAACLGWTPLEDAVSIEGPVVRLYLRRAAVGVGPHAIRLVTVDVYPAEAPAEAAPGIASLRLQATDGIAADFRVERTSAPGHVLTAAEVAGHAPISRLARCEEPTLADLLAAELRLLSRDHTFERALRVAATFAARLP